MLHPTFARNLRLITIVASLFSLHACAQPEKSKASFSAKFVQEQKGKVLVSIPEVQELVHIIFAITEKGLSDSDMVNHEGPYYSDVIKHFKPFANEEIVLKMNKDLKGSWFMGSKYSRLKMDACCFYFSGHSILKDSTYKQLNWDNMNYIDPM